MEYIKVGYKFYPMSSVVFEVIENTKECSLTLQMEIGGHNKNPVFIADLTSNAMNNGEIQSAIAKIKINL